MEIKEITQKEIWEDFFLGSDDKTFLQSWNWGEFQKANGLPADRQGNSARGGSAVGGKIWRLGVYDNGELFSVALISKIMARRGTFLLIQHGPIIKNSKSEILISKEIPNSKFEILNSLLGELKRIGKQENCSFVRMNPLWERNDKNKNILKKLGFVESPMHANAYESTWKLDIKPPEEDLLRNMRKTTRYLIRQAEKNQDITIERNNDIAGIEQYQKLNEQVAKRQKFVPFSLNYIKNEFEFFSKDNEILWFFGKYKNRASPQAQQSLVSSGNKEEVVAAALIIFWQGIGFYHQAASDAKYAKLSVPYLLQWEAIKEAKRRGCALYDFWGYVDPQKHPRHPWAGPTLFKMGFGGRVYEYVKTQDFPLSKKYWLTYAFEGLRKIKRNL